jgi:heptosyltransferase-1
MPRQDYKRIFVLTPEGAGDMVFCLPTLYALKDNLPDASIQLASSRVQKHLANTLEGKLIDRVVRLYNQRTGVGQFLHLLDAVRRHKPDLFLDFDGAFRYGVVGRLSSATRRIHPPAELTTAHASMIHPETLPFNRSGHRVETLLALLDMLAMPRRRISFEFDTPERYRESADAVARQHIPPGSIAIIPSAGQSSKDWPADRLQAAIDVLSRDLGREVVVLGKAQHSPRLRNATDLGGMTDFLTDAYLLRYSGVFAVAVGVDTGMMQIAGSVSSDPGGGYEKASGNRTVSLFGPTEPSIYRPYDPTGRFNFVIKPRKKSEAMGMKGWAGDRFTRPYMSELDLQEIVDRISQHLDARRAAGD